MAGLKGIYWCFICLISFVGLESAQIYVIDVPDEDSDLMFNKKYDDYDPLNIDYDEVIKRPNDQNILNPENKGNRHINLCQRLFGSMYGHGKQQIRCLQTLKSNGRSYFGQPKTIKIQPEYRYYRLSARQKQLKPFRDLTQFSQDYLDVNDLAREGFDGKRDEDFKSSDVKPDCDIIEFDEFGDMTDANCVPSRKWGLLQSIQKLGFKARVNTDSDSDSSESEEPVKKKRKPKRYKVVKYDNDKNSQSTSDESDAISKKPQKPDVNSDLGPEIDNISLDSGAESFKNLDSSIEEPVVPTKKRKTKKTAANEKYEYLQGNNYYNANDFRRRLSYFLPKRLHWDEDQFQRLGYYWYNGPKGKFI